MDYKVMNLNIRHDASDEIWNKVPFIYSQMTGWLGFGTGGDHGEEGIPYWFSYNEDDKHIFASVEPAGLQFSGFMDDMEWEAWKLEIKRIATKELGYKVGEIENGKVSF